MAIERNYSTKKRSAAWIVTFADLMALLLTFFIMMLSFSHMDMVKYQAVVESMEEAFNVADTDAEQTEFEDIAEFTDTLVKRYVEDGRSEKPPQFVISESSVEASLHDELEKGVLDVEMVNGNVVIRFPEKVAFPSGSAKLHNRFNEILEKIITILTQSQGEIVISGHTDNIPINNGEFRSNWELSTARAVSVVEAILMRSKLEDERFVVQGYADTKPLLPNNIAENRMVNRRVEISIESSAVDNE